eukprot:g41395.t1
MSLSGVTVPGSRGLQAKLSLYMEDFTIFCSDPLSVCRHMGICNQFKLASGAKVNRGKSEAMFFENQADRSLIPITIRIDYLKVLAIWFGGTGRVPKLGRSILP